MHHELRPTHNPSPDVPPTGPTIPRCKSSTQKAARLTVREAAHPRQHHAVFQSHRPHRPQPQQHLPRETASSIAVQHPTYLAQSRCSECYQMSASRPCGDLVSSAKSSSQISWRAVESTLKKDSDKAYVCVKTAVLPVLIAKKGC